MLVWKSKGFLNEKYAGILQIVGQEKSKREKWIYFMFWIVLRYLLRQLKSTEV